MTTWGQGSTRAWRKTRTEVLERDHHTCQLNYDVCTGMATQVDHITNLASTGHTRRDTVPASALQAVCQPCHQVKTNREAHEARRTPQWRRQAEPHPGRLSNPPKIN